MINVKFTKLPVAFVTIGYPGCGKSSFFKYCDEKVSDLVRLSSDQIIEDKAKKLDKTYNDIFNSEIKAANKQYRKELSECIETRRNIYIDRTNLTLSARKKLVERLSQYKYYVVSLDFSNAPYQMIDQINRERKDYGRAIPPHAINNMRESFTTIQPDEKFDLIIPIDFSDRLNGWIGNDEIGVHDSHCPYPDYYDTDEDIIFCKYGMERCPYNGKKYGDFKYDDKN